VYLTISACLINIEAVRNCKIFVVKFMNWYLFGENFYVRGCIIGIRHYILCG
jgi:hypothetical protein